VAFYRRNLPHWHPENRPIFLTWRLYNSLPASIVSQARTAKSVCATKKTPPGIRFRILDAALDKATTGPLWLRDPIIATHIIETLRKGESTLHQYSLHSFVVMPNHVHILISPNAPLSRITNGIKGVTSHRAKSILALQQKHFWQDESFDHWVRSPEQFDTIRAYIENNPVMAGLAAHPKDWPWSSCSAIVDEIDSTS